jgi:hypothetical protein
VDGTVTIDLTGGLPLAREHVFAERPDNPDMRDSASFWIIDDRGEVALPRIGVEAVASRWEAHDIQVNVTLVDGRVYRLRAGGPAVPALGPEGLPTVLGAGGLVFRCVEPFRTWMVTFEGVAVQTSSADLVEGRRDGPLVAVSFEVETTMVVPPWVQGALLRSEGERLATSIEGGLMGGDRYEQLFTAAGRLLIGGSEEHVFTGRGLRIRRQGVRRLAGFWGHAWQSAVFPSGRAFGYMAYPPRADGQPTFNEGFVFTGDGVLVPARVTEAPWLRRLQASGEDVSLTLETADGPVDIAGETVFSTHDIHHNDDMASMKAMMQEMPDFPALQQAGVGYAWDGETAFGMLERSSPMSEISGGAGD